MDNNGMMKIESDSTSEFQKKVRYKLWYLKTLKTKRWPDIALFQIFECVSNVYLSVCNNPMVVLNHLMCYLISCPIFLAALSVSIMSLFNVV